LGSFAVTTHAPPHDLLYGGHPHWPEMHCSFEPAGHSVAEVHPLPLPPFRPTVFPVADPLEAPEEVPVPEELPRIPEDAPFGPPSAPLPSVIESPSLPHATTTPTPSVTRTKK
jgi:hypothetical protein